MSIFLGKGAKMVGIPVFANLLDVHKILEHIFESVPENLGGQIFWNRLKNVSRIS